MASKAPVQAHPVLSVIVVFWNGRDDAPTLMESLANCRDELPFPMEVIAVDNASTDGTPEWIATQAPWVRLIRNSENLGFAVGCNAGLAIARGQFLLLLNPDCEANREALKALVHLLKRKPSVGMAACRLLNADGTRQFNHYREPGPLSYLLTHSMGASVFAKVRRMIQASSGTRPFRTDWLMGACIATRRDVVDRIGLMEESYFLYAEDTDWCRRARDAGYAVVLAPKTAIRHRQGTAARKRAEFAFRQLYRSLVRYSLQHHNTVQRIAISATMIVDMTLRLPIYLLTGRWQRARSALFIIGLIARQNPDYGRAPDEGPGGPGST